MDIPQVLAVLRPGQDWGPCAQTDSTYEQLAASWRGTDPVPTLAEMQAEWDTLVSTQAARTAAALRAAADTLLNSDPAAPNKVLRAVVLTLVDELNLLRARCRDQDAAVAAATSLADLKTRWATVASADPLPARTISQAKSAVQSHIDAGDAD